MSRHGARIVWQRGDQGFTDLRYRRNHLWQFDGGAEVPASSSPAVVPLPYSDPAAVDPEEAFVASLASCHMLWFLSLAAEHGLRVDAYLDEPMGVMGRDEHGQVAMLEVTLRPQVDWGSVPPPDAAAVKSLHDAAHERCFLARSVRTRIRIALH
jgi:organic hydroperoxide reductase OsmC/OhrA